MKIEYRKSFLVMVLLFILVGIGIPIVQANSGPPANIQITVVNYDIDFSFDLLVYRDTLLTQDEIDEARNKILEREYPFYETYFPVEYASYQDSEGYVSSSLYGGSNYLFANENDDNNTFTAQMLMNVPREFKIILYTEAGIIITSELIIMSQFDYRLTYDLANVDMTVNQSNAGIVSGYIGNPWLNITTWVNFLLRLLLTLMIEIGILYLFGFRKKSTFLLITGMNIISQIALNIALISVFYLSYNNGYAYVFTFIVGEFFVFLIEALLVSIFIKEHKVLRRLSYSLIANATSLIIGLLVASWLSFII